MKLIMKTLRKLLVAVELFVVFLTYKTVDAMRPSRFWDVTQKSWVASYRCLGTTYRAHFKSQAIQESCPEMSLTTNQRSVTFQTSKDVTLRRKPEITDTSQSFFRTVSNFTKGSKYPYNPQKKIWKIYWIYHGTQDVPAICNTICVQLILCLWIPTVKNSDGSKLKLSGIVFILMLT